MVRAPLPSMNKNAAVCTLLRTQGVTSKVSSAHARTMGHVLKAGAGRPVVELRSELQKLRARASHIAFGSITLVPQDAGLESLAEKLITLELDGTGLGPVAGRLGHWERTARGDLASVVFTFEQVSRRLARKLTVLASKLELERASSTSALHAEEIDAPERVATILRALVSNNSQTLIRAHDTDWVLQADSMSSTQMRWRIVGAGGVPTSPLVLDAVGHSGVYRLPVLIVDQDEHTITTTRPSYVGRVRQRRMPRGRPSRHYGVSFRHPLWDDEVVEAEVVDLAHGGLGIVFDPLEDLLHPGMRIPSLELRLDGRLSARFQANIRSAPASPGDLAVCGLELEPLSSEDARVWRRIVSEELHGATEDFPSDPEHVWSLFCESGYLNLSGKRPEEFDELHTAFVASSNKLRSAPEIGCQVVWPAAIGVTASVTQLKIFSGCWLGFHMAKVPGKVVDGIPGRRILRDIHLHSIEHLLADRSMRWFMSYIQDNGSRFSKLAMLEFLNRVDDQEKACAIPFTAVEMPAVGRRVSEERVRSASDVDRTLVLRAIAQLRPASYCGAHDYTAERFSLDAIRTAWRSAGLVRDREVLVALEEGRPVAAAVLELGEDGLHLFGLLDIVRLFPLAPGGEQHFDHLLRAASAWYAGRGKSKFILMDEWSTVIDAALSPHSLGGATCAILADELIPDYLDHFFEWMAWAPTGASEAPAALGVAEESGLCRLSDLVRPA